jgi:hypothetical protein
MLAYPHKVVLIKTGAKDAEKRFLGYEFSNRRGAAKASTRHSAEKPLTNAQNSSMMSVSITRKKQVPMFTKRSQEIMILRYTKV